MVKLHLLHREAPFQDRRKLTHRRDTKILKISRVGKGELIRTVSSNLSLLNPGILTDRIEFYCLK
jgi:hypothetical protein